MGHCAPAESCRPVSMMLTVGTHDLPMPGVGEGHIRNAAAASRYRASSLFSFALMRKLHARLIGRHTLVFPALSRCSGSIHRAAENWKKWSNLVEPQSLIDTVYASLKEDICATCEKYNDHVEHMLLRHTTTGYRNCIAHGGDQSCRTYRSDGSWE